MGIAGGNALSAFSAARSDTRAQGQTTSQTTFALPSIAPTPPQRVGDVESFRVRRRVAAGGISNDRAARALRSQNLLQPKNPGQTNRLIRESLKTWPSYAESGADQDQMALWVLAYLLTTTFELESSKTRTLIELLGTPTETAGSRPTEASLALDGADQRQKQREELAAKHMTAVVLKATGIAALVQLVPFLDTALKLADLAGQVSTVWQAMTDIDDINALIQSGQEVGVLGLLAEQMIDYAAEMKAEAAAKAVVGVLNISVNIGLPKILASALNVVRQAKDASDELVKLSEFVLALRLTQYNLATLAAAGAQGDLIHRLTVAAKLSFDPNDESLNANLSRLAKQLTQAVPHLTPMSVLRWVVQTNPILAPLMMPGYGGMRKFLTKTVVLQGDDAPKDGLLDRVTKAIDAANDLRAYQTLQEFIANAGFDDASLWQAVQRRRATNAIAHIDQRKAAAWDYMNTCAFGALLLGLKPSGFLTAPSATLQQATNFADDIFTLPQMMAVPRRLGPAKMAILAMTRQADTWRKERDLVATRPELARLVGMRNALNPILGQGTALPPLTAGQGFVSTQPQG